MPTSCPPSDGCDVKVRGLRLLGVRPSKEPVISVTDASAVWFLQILAATAQASLPIAPHLQVRMLSSGLRIECWI